MQKKQKMENSSFFHKSQEIKKEIESNFELQQTIKACFSNSIEPFSSGTEHEIYRIGRSKTGTFLVLRKKKYSTDVGIDIETFDMYCQNAETLASSRSTGIELQRPISVSFCIGVVFNSKESGIITEDMSEGGKYEMSNAMSDYYSERKLNGSIVDRVFVDLDSCRVDGYFWEPEIVSTTSYFAPEHRLEITG